jgi:hypothetical protein
VDATRLMRAAAVFAAFAAFAVSSTPAVAQSCLPEEEVAALDQYCDALPTADGEPESMIGSGGTRSEPPLRLALPSRHVARLRRSGVAAKALLLLPTPRPVGKGPAVARERRRTAVEARKVVASGTLKSPVGSVREVVSSLATSSEDVVEGAFRWGLVLCTLGLAGMAWVRFRTRLRL